MFDDSTYGFKLIFHCCVWLRGVLNLRTSLGTGTTLGKNNIKQGPRIEALSYLAHAISSDTRFRPVATFALEKSSGWSELFYEPPRFPHLFPSFSHQFPIPSHVFPPFSNRFKISGHHRAVSKWSWWIPVVSSDEAMRDRSRSRLVPLVLKPYINVWMYIYMYVYVYLYVYVYVYIYIYVYLYVHLYVYVYIYKHIYVYIYTYMCMYVYIYMRIYVYVHIYIYTHYSE